MDFIQLLPYNQKRDDAQADRKALWFEKTLANQVGLRWIAEALCPTVDDVLPTQHIAPYAIGSLSSVRDWNQQPSTIPEDEFKARDTQFGELLTHLEQKMTVLVGHK